MFDIRVVAGAHVLGRDAQDAFGAGQDGGAARVHGPVEFCGCGRGGCWEGERGGGGGEEGVEGWEEGGLGERGDARGEDDFPALGVGVEAEVGFGGWEGLVVPGEEVVDWWWWWWLGSKGGEGVGEEDGAGAVGEEGGADAGFLEGVDGLELAAHEGGADLEGDDEDAGGLAAVEWPRARLAAVRRAARPPLQPTPWRSTFSVVRGRPRALATKWSYPGFAESVHVVETMWVTSAGATRASARAFRAALTASGTPSDMKTAWRSAMVGGAGWFTTGWSGVPMEERRSMPV